MRHPHALNRRQVLEGHPGNEDPQRCAAVLAQPGALNRAPEGTRHGLESVADAEDGDVGLEQLGIE